MIYLVVAEKKTLKNQLDFMIYLDSSNDFTKLERHLLNLS